MNYDPNNYWEQLERLEKLIRASELKAGVVFSFHGLILGIFVDRMDKLEPIMQQGNIYIVLVVAWMFFVFLSIFYCFKCFSPQMEMKYEKNVFFFRDSVYSFGDIDEYTKKLIEVCSSEEDLCKQLGHQIHAESKIIDEKFRSVQKAIRYFSISFGIIILAILVWVVKLYL